MALATKDIVNNLYKLLDSKKMRSWVEKWKNEQMREKYLIIAERAHQRLREVIEEWKQDENKLTFERFDAELLAPVHLEISGLGEPQRAWNFCKNESWDKEKIKRGFEDNSIRIVKGNPAWKEKMPLFSSLQPESKGKRIADLPPAKKNQLAREIIKILLRGGGNAVEKYNEVKQEVEHVKKETAWKGGIGVSLLTSILHILEPDNYVHIDEHVFKSLGKLGGEQIGVDENFLYKLESPNDFSKYFEKVNELFLNMKERLQFHNLCDVYWFLRWIEQKPEAETGINSSEELRLRNYFQSKGFQFSDEQICAFYNALKTKGFVILAGLSGTGKTKIVQLFAELVSDNKEQVCFLSVRPDWRDSTYLIGFYNPITREYQSTPLLKLILNAREDTGKPYFLILDEMNLAHVEYYFADFLSVLESGRNEKGFSKESIKLHSASDVVMDEEGKEIPQEIKLPPNIYIIGTVNIDETTYMFSPKVLDRAFTIEFREVDLEEYPSEHIALEGSWENLRAEVVKDLVNDNKFYAYNKEDIANAVRELGDFKDELKELNDILLDYELGFGYRVVDEISLFLKNAKKEREFLPKLDENAYKDLAILMKVLPKFHGPRGKVEIPLFEVLKFCATDTLRDDIKNKKTWDEICRALLNQEGTPRDVLREWDELKKGFKYPLTAKKVLEMLSRLYETGFTSFM